ncbi:MAG TPA: GtrA family protein [Thermodesulfovibrionales bacterium]|nr:GtrA family protein [Thermodesulfovibrionales bacterium]
MSKKDYRLAAAAGLLIGLLALPVLKALAPASFGRSTLILVPFLFIATPLGLAIIYSLSRKFSLLWQVGKFAVIGVLNMFVDWGVMASLIFLMRNSFRIDSKDSIMSGITFYSLYKAASFIVANINSYYWNKYWTFAVQTTKKTNAEFLQFLVVSLIGFVANVLVASFVFESLRPIIGFTIDQRGIIGAAVGSAAGFLWNFVGYKFIVFKER